MPERITHAEFRERLRAQGVSSNLHYAFKCPACKTVQSASSLIKAGAGADLSAVEQHVGFNCVGRFTGAGNSSRQEPETGCDWSLGGLFQIHNLVVQPTDGRVWPVFDLATPEVAQALEAKNRELARHD